MRAKRKRRFVGDGFAVLATRGVEEGSGFRGSFRFLGISDKVAGLRLQVKLEGFGVDVSKVLASRVQDFPPLFPLDFGLGLGFRVSGFRFSVEGVGADIFEVLVSCEVEEGFGFQGVSFFLWISGWVSGFGFRLQGRTFLKVLRLVELRTVPTFGTIACLRIGFGVWVEG